ncbi:MAG: hypothetical protein R2750_05375 [Bacteroidales bacterium]
MHRKTSMPSPTYSKTSNKPSRKATAVTGQNTPPEAICDKFREADGLLRNKLDKLILIFQPANPEFVSRYFNARIIIDLGVRHTKDQTIISGLVEDRATRQPTSRASTSGYSKKASAFSTGPTSRFTNSLTEGGTFPPSKPKNQATKPTPTTPSLSNSLNPNSKSNSQQYES